MRTEAEKAEYYRYLKSAAWKRIRASVIADRGWACEDCQSTARIQVHHLRYPLELGTETPDMLRIVCHACHMQYHPDKPYGPKKARKREQVRLTAEERRAVKRLRWLARRERKVNGGRVPSNAELVALVRSGHGPKPKRPRQRVFVVRGETPSLKDRFGGMR